MATDVGAPIGWWVRIALLWAAAALAAVVALALFYEYGARVLDINAAYLAPSLSDSDLQAINERWVAAELLARVAVPLVGAALLLVVLTLGVQAWGWQIRRARGSARLSGRPSR
jgi:hypothetical protein